MTELTEYRENLLVRLDQAAKEFRTLCLAVKEPQKPLGDGEWNIHQLAVHTRDVDKLVYGFRVRQTLLEDNPTFPNFDGDSYMTQHYDLKESLSGLLDELIESVESHVKLLRAMPSEGWSRLSSHVTQGSGLTLQHWVERSLGHIEEHLATVRNAK